MKLKSKLRLALELCLVTSALPLLLLGCGGGGGGGGSGGGVQGQYWTDFTSASGVRNFTPGYAPTSGVAGYYSGFYAAGNIEKGTVSGGSYISSLVPKQMTASGVWSTATVNAYYLAASGWTVDPLTAVITATDATHFQASNVLTGSSQGTISTIDLSGMPIVASSAVPAVTALGMASAVSPASAVYPAGSYEYVTVTTSTTASTGYQLWTGPEFAVTTTTAGSLSGPLDLATFRAHTTTATPFCVNGRAWVKSATGTDTYDGYALTFNSAPVAVGTMETCQNAHIAAGAIAGGTYVLSLISVSGETIIRFTNPTGWSPGDPFASYFIGLSPADSRAYIGAVFPAGTTSDTSYQLNKTAMDAALTAWGVPTF